jgi:hypothetical protein
MRSFNDTRTKRFRGQFPRYLAEKRDSGLSERLLLRLAEAAT